MSRKQIQAHLHIQMCTCNYKNMFLNTCLVKEVTFALHITEQTPQNNAV